MNNTVKMYKTHVAFNVNSCHLLFRFLALEGEKAAGARVCASCSEAAGRGVKRRQAREGR